MDSAVHCPHAVSLTAGFCTSRINHEEKMSFCLDFTCTSLGIQQTHRSTACIHWYRHEHTHKGSKSRPQYFIFIDIIQHCMVIHSHRNNTKTYKDSISLLYIQYNIHLWHQSSEHTSRWNN